VVDEVSREIVGIVGAIRYKGLDKPREPHVYLPNYQGTWRWAALAIRTAQDADSLGPAVRRTVHGLDPQLAVGTLETLERLLRNSTGKLRMATGLVGTLAVIAVVLACIGVFGVVELAIRRQARELAIRIAVGAPRGAMLRLAVVDGLAVGFFGILAGLWGALALTRLLAGLLYEVGHLDAGTFSTAAAAIAGILVVTSLAAAARIVRLDPARVLRTE
jgi:putative ABC transport system permease protein